MNADRENDGDEPFICRAGDTEIPKERFGLDPNPQYENLVLEGGGVLGLCYVGALRNLHMRNILAGMRNFSGSSAGSIVAAALACGASFNFLYSELSKLNLMNFLDYGNKLKAVYNLYYYYGFCRGDVLMKWFEDFIEKLTGNKDITLGEIHERFGGRLVITGTRLGRSLSEKVESSRVYFDYNTHPNMQLKVALRISTSIPIVFMPYFYEGYYWVDGGMLDNYPIHAFHHNTDNSDIINPKTLGLMLVTEADDGLNLPPIKDIYSFVHCLTSCIFNQSQKLYIDPQDWARTIKIQCGKISSLDFDIDESGQAKLVQNGYDAVEKFFTDKK